MCAYVCIYLYIKSIILYEDTCNILHIIYTYSIHTLNVRIQAGVVSLGSKVPASVTAAEETDSSSSHPPFGNTSSASNLEKLQVHQFTNLLENLCLAIKKVNMPHQYTSAIRQICTVVMLISCAI